MTDVIENYGGVISADAAAAMVVVYGDAMGAYAGGKTDLLRSIYYSINDRVLETAGDAWIDPLCETPVEARAWEALRWLVEDMNQDDDQPVGYWEERSGDIAAWFPEFAVQRWISQGLDRDAALSATALEGLL